MNAKPLVIFGTGVQARLAAYFFDTDSDYSVVAFCVDDEYYEDSEFLDCPVIRRSELSSRFPSEEYELFVAMGYQGMNKPRAKVYDEMKEMGYSLATYISSRCSYLSQFPPGDNCLILEDNTVQPFVRIGNNVTLWSGNHIGHDSVIGDHCNITSHVVVSGFCEIGACSFIGVNATLRDGLKLGEEVLIGAGAVVLNDLEDKSVIVPAKSVVLEKKSDQLRI